MTNEQTGKEDGFEFFARIGAENLHDLANTLAILAEQPRGLLSQDGQDELKKAHQSITYGMTELLKVLQRFDLAVDRGEAIVYISEIANAAYVIGRDGSSDRQTVDAVFAESQRLRARASVIARQTKQEAWQNHCRAELPRIRGANPALKPDDIADVLRRDWPAGPDAPFQPAVRTLSEFIRTL